MGIAVEQPLQNRGILVVDDGDEGRPILGSRSDESGCFGGLHQVKHRVHVVGQFRRRWPHAAHVAADALQLIDQRVTFHVARMNDQDSRTTQFFDEAADARLHETGTSSPIQRAPSGDTAR